jgi:hypothetical protein
MAQVPSYTRRIRHLIHDVWIVAAHTECHADCAGFGSIFCRTIQNQDLLLSRWNLSITSSSSAV